MRHMNVSKEMVRSAALDYAQKTGRAAYIWFTNARDGWAWDPQPPSIDEGRRVVKVAPDAN